MSENKSSLDHMPDNEKWEFNDGVVTCFDDMLERSIPGYNEMRELVFDVGQHFQRRGFEIMDLGASRGGAIDPFIKKFGAYNHYTLIEVSEPMLRVLNDRFSNYIDSNIVDVSDLDLRKEYPPVRACITLSILTLQFTPIEHRFKILDNIYQHTTDGGCFILVEKLIGENPISDRLLSELYYNFKHKNGYSYESIDRKKLSLEGVLVPLSQEYNTDMLKKAGFKHVECFWRSLNFAGLLAVK